MKQLIELLSCNIVRRNKLLCDRLWFFFKQRTSSPFVMRIEFRRGPDVGALQRFAFDSGLYLDKRAHQIPALVPTYGETGLQLFVDGIASFKCFFTIRQQ